MFIELILIYWARISTSADSIPLVVRHPLRHYLVAFHLDQLRQPVAAIYQLVPPRLRHGLDYIGVVASGYLDEKE